MRRTSFTRSARTPVLLVDICSKCSASSAEVTLLLNLENQSKTCVLPTVCSPEGTFNVLEVSVVRLQSLKRNLKQTCCSLQSVIFYVHHNDIWNSIHLYLMRFYYPTIIHTTVLFQKGNGSADPFLSSSRSSSKQQHHSLEAYFILYLRICIVTHVAYHHQPYV